MPETTAVLEIDPDGRVAAASPAAAALVGATPAEAAGRPFDAWVTAADRPAARAVLGRLHGGEVEDASLRVAGPGGGPLWVTLRRGPGGRVVGRVRADRRARPAPDDATQADRLRLLATVTAQGDLPFEDQVSQALALTTRLLGLDVGLLSRVEGDDYTVVACFAPGADLAPGARFALGETYCAITLGGRDLLAIDHMAASPHRRHPCYEAFGLESYVGIPVQLGGEPWGTLSFSAGEPLGGPLSEADRDLVRVLATWVSGALDRRARTAALAEEGGRLRAVVDAAPVVLYALDADGRFTLSEGRGLRALGLAPNEVNGQSVFDLYADLPDALSAIRDVLAGHERTWTTQIGPLSYEAWGSPVFDGAGRVAGMTGVSVDVTAVREAEGRVRHEAHRLHRLLNVTAADGPFEERAEAVLAELTALLGLDGGALVQTLDGVTTCLASWARDGAPPAPGAERPLGETYCDLVVGAGGVVAVHHVGESEHRGHPCYAAAGHEAYIGAPVLVDGEAHGAVGVASARPAAPFTEADRELVRLAAQWAGGLLERDRRQRALAVSERRLRALSTSTVEAIAFSADGVIVDCNDQFVELFGLAGRAEAIGTPAASLAAPEHRATVRRRMAAGHTEPYEVEGLRADGSRFWAAVQSGPAEYDGRPVRMTALRDVTRRREAEAQTRFQADVLAHVSDAVVALDLDGRVTYWNAGAELLHGLPAEAVLGRPLDGLVRYRVPEAGGDVPARAALQGEAGGPGDLLCEAPDGRRRVVSVSASLLRDADGAERGTLAVLRDVTAPREMAARLRHQAHHDALTGLPNRARFREHVERALRQGRPSAVLFVDLDRFKTVNDSLGHEAGDRLLRAVAARMRAAVAGAVGPDGAVARLGGDEFAVVASTDAEGAATLAGRVLEALAAPVDLGPRAIAPGASVGVVARAERYGDPEALLRDADTAMYEAKRSGRGRYALFDPSMHRAAAARFGLEHDLREAVAGDQLRLRIQPIVDLATGAPAGFESLVRWEHPERGLCGPGQFIPLAEELGLVAEIDRWVLEATCREVAAWPEVPGPLLMVSVNCSDQSFLADDLAERACAAADAAGIDRDRLVLELTERALVESKAAAAALQELRACGVQLCVDDFGSGYSSLGLLHRLPVDGLKIDRSFVSDLETSAEARAVVRAVVGLARELGLRAVAEGIETPGQLAVLREAGCPYGQGYLFSPPVPPDAARDLLDRAPWAEGWPGT
jgi:diguanylate cyclase (GGDEF)-like protein/PAS domain S-box-containing protein